MLDKSNKKTYNNKKYATEEHITLAVILLEFGFFFNNLLTGEPFMAIIWLCLIILSILGYKDNYCTEENNDKDKE